MSHVPAMPSVPPEAAARLSAAMIPPEEADVQTTADVGKRSAYNHMLHELHGRGLPIPYEKLGEGTKTVVTAAGGGGGGFTAADRAVLHNLQATVGAKLGNVRKLMWNGASGLPSHELEPLMREEAGGAVGQAPPPGLFPSTRAAANVISGRDLDALAAFYGCQFAGTNMEERRLSFAKFIGTI